MPARKRTYPLIQFEHGTRVYAPTADTPQYRVVALDLEGKRQYFKFRSEADAKAKARAFDEAIGAKRPTRRCDETRTVGDLADRWLADHVSSMSRNYQQKVDRVLRNWVLPRLADIEVLEWTPADSQAVLSSVRAAGRGDALRQDVGSIMRGLVTHARRMRWLTARDEDPMWLVSYSPKSGVQGESVHFIPRSGLPTDEQCEALFAAMVSLGEDRWALAMRLKHRSGLRWGELTALQAADLSFEPARVVHVRRASEPGAEGGRALKAPKNGRVRTSIFPKSLEYDLRKLQNDVDWKVGPEGLLFPNSRGGLPLRKRFHEIWIRSAELAGWPMKRAVRQTPKTSSDKGRRWTGAALWTPHDLRHVAACWMLFDLKLDPAVVAAKLGHSDPSFTVKRYVGVRGDADLRATQATEDW